MGAESVPENVGREIVAAGRRLYARGLIGGSEGNISVRLDGARVMATPGGACKGFLEPDLLVVTDLEGRRLAGRENPSSELKMHLRIYHLRDDVRAVVHAHPPAATGFAIAGRPLDECVVPEVIATLGQVPIVPYGTPSTEDLPERLAPYVQAHDALLLANHGAVTFAPTLARALNAMESIEQAARSMLVAHLLGRINRLTREDVDSLLALDAYGMPVRNPGCAWTAEAGPGGAGGPGGADDDLRRRIAGIVRETLNGTKG
ncbi:MAG TPA: class II aldolase/adducin family protein [Gemmatimonadota bacterium]|nr:class II aldolase/adducin family protein [Gemmatimonadota bacterium]